VLTARREACTRGRGTTLLTTETAGNAPPRERHDHWNEYVLPALMPVTVRARHAGDRQPRIRCRDLGTLTVAEVELPPMEVVRTARMTRRHDPEFFQLWVTVDGSVGVSQRRRETVCHRPDGVLCNVSRPFRGFASAAPGRGTAAGVVVHMPRAALPLHRRALDRLTAVRLPGRTGIGLLASRYLTDLPRHADQVSSATRARLAHVTRELVAAWLGQSLDAAAALPADAYQQGLRASIRDFIDRRLGDPGLSPAVIAAAHGISVRFLYRLFQDEPLSVAGWIRERRLARCRADLSDPRLASRPVHAIGARWGFPDPAHFSRVFRQAYGMPPQEYRRRAGAGQV
jgi:AraC-like DNA-binding protein